MADEGATFYFDTNIEDVVDRVVSSLGKIQRDVNKDSGGTSSKLLANLPRDLGQVVDQAKAKIGQLNAALKDNSLSGDLTKGYQKVIKDLNESVGKIAKGRGLDTTVAIKFSDAAVKPFIADLKKQLAEALKNVPLAPNVGSGKLFNRRADVESGFNADSGEAKAYAKAIGDSAKAAAANAKALKAAGDAATVTAQAALGGAAAQKEITSAKERTATAQKRIAVATEAEAAAKEKHAKAAQDAPAKKSAPPAAAAPTKAAAAPAPAKAPPPAPAPTTKAPTSPATIDLSFVTKIQAEAIKAVQAAAPGASVSATSKLSVPTNQVQALVNALEARVTHHDSKFADDSSVDQRGLDHASIQIEHLDELILQLAEQAAIAGKKITLTTQELAAISAPPSALKAATPAAAQEKVASSTAGTEQVTKLYNQLAKGLIVEQEFAEELHVLTAKGLHLDQSNLSQPVLKASYDALAKFPLGGAAAKSEHRFDPLAGIDTYKGGNKEYRDPTPDRSSLNPDYKFNYLESGQQLDLFKAVKQYQTYKGDFQTIQPHDGLSDKTSLQVNVARSFEALTGRARDLAPALKILTDAIRNSLATGPDAFRGIKGKRADALIEEARSGQVHLPISSFSDNPTVANSFAGVYGGKVQHQNTAVQLQVEAGAKGLDFNNAHKFPALNPFRSESEFLTGGKFDVVGVHEDKEIDGLTHVILRARQDQAVSDESLARTRHEEALAAQRSALSAGKIAEAEQHAALAAQALADITAAQVIAARRLAAERAVKPVEIEDLSPAQKKILANVAYQQSLPAPKIGPGIASIQTASLPQLQLGLQGEKAKTESDLATASPIFAEHDREKLRAIEGLEAILKQVAANLDQEAKATDESAGAARDVTDGYRRQLRAIEAGTPAPEPARQLAIGAARPQLAIESGVPTPNPETLAERIRAARQIAVDRAGTAGVINSPIPPAIGPLESSGGTAQVKSLADASRAADAAQSLVRQRVREAQAATRAADAAEAEAQSAEAARAAGAGEAITRAQARLASIYEALATRAGAQETRLRAEGAIAVKPTIVAGAAPRQTPALGVREDIAGSGLARNQGRSEQEALLRIIAEALRRQGDAVEATTVTILEVHDAFRRIQREVQRVLEAARKQAEITAGPSREQLAIGSGPGPARLALTARGEGGGSELAVRDAVAQELSRRDNRGELALTPRISAVASDLPRTRAITSGLSPEVEQPLNLGVRARTDQENLTNLTGGTNREFAAGVVPLSEKFVADTRGELEKIYEKTKQGFVEVEQGLPEFVQNMAKLRKIQDAAAKKAATDLQRESAATPPADLARNRQLLTQGAEQSGGFAQGVETIGGAGSKIVADTRDIETRIFKQVQGGFEEILKGSTEFDQQVRRLRAQQESQGKGGVVNSFIQGATAGSFLNSGSGKVSISGALDGLARSAGTTAKYAVLGSAFYQLQRAISGAAGELADFSDSYSNFNAALEGGNDLDGIDSDLTVTQSTINKLADVATIAGTNVGEAMDVAADGVRAFRDQTDGSQAALEQLGVTFASEAQKIKLITGTDLKDAAGNLKTTELAFGVPVSASSRITDATAGAKNLTGADPAQISQGAASVAVAAKEAGFTLEETFALVGKIQAETDESGSAAATRFAKITAILGGSAGKAAITNLNQSLPDAQKIDTSADVKTQVQELSQVYGQLGNAQRQQLINSLGGTANARELIILLQSANGLIAQADKGFDGLGNKEVERQLNNIRATFTKINGEIKQITVALTTSGVLDPFLALVNEGLLPALDAVRRLLQLFDLIPRPLRDAGFAALELYGVFKLIAALVRSTSVKQFFSGISAAVVPARLSADRLKAGEVGAAGAAEAAGAASVIGAATAAARTGAPSPAGLAGKVATTAVEAEAATAAATVRRSRLLGIQTGGRAAGGDVFAGAKIAQAKFLTGYTSLLYNFSGQLEDVRREKIIDLANQGTPEAQRTLDALGVPPSDPAEQRRRLHTGDTGQENLTRRERLGNSVERGKFNASSVLNTLGFGTQPTGIVPEGEEAIAKKAGGLRGIGKSLKGIGADIGPEIGIAAGALAIQGTAEAGAKINAAIKEFDKLKDLTPQTFGVDDLRNSAATLQAGAKALRESSGGFFGTITNFVRGDETGVRAKALNSEASFQKAQAAHLEQAQAKARVGSGANLASTIDLSSSDSLSSSIEGLAGAGRNATTQFRALLGALDLAAASAKGLGTNLTPIQKTKVAGATGVKFQAGLISAQDDARFALTAAGAAQASGKSTFKGALRDADLDVLSAGQIPRLEKSDSALGRFVRKHVAGKGSEENLQLSKVDASAVAQGVTDTTQKFLDDGNSISTPTGQADLKTLYTQYLTQKLPKLNAAQIDKLASNALSAAVAGTKALTSIKDPTATLQQIEQQGNQLADSAAQEAGVQASLGRGKNQGVNGKGSSLTAADLKLKGYQEVYDRKKALGESTQALESQQATIDAATVEDRSAFAARQDQKNQLALSKINPADATKLAQTRLDQANAKLARGKKTTKTTREKVLVGRGDNAHFALQDVTVSTGGGLESGELDAAQAEKNQAEQAVAQVKLADTSAARRLKVDPRDEIGNAKADLKDAKDQVAALEKDNLTGAALDAAKLARHKAFQTGKALAAQAAIAARNVDAIPASSYDTATRALNDANTTLGTLKKNSIAYNQQLAVVHQAQLGLATAMNDIKSINRQLSIDLTNPVQTAQEAVQTAQDKLNTDRNQKYKDPIVKAQVLGQDQLNLRSAQNNEASAEFSKFLSDTQTADQLGRISHKAYLGLLKSRRDNLAVELKGLDPNSNGYNQIQDEINQLDSSLKSGADALSGVFNIGDIKTPTPYEVRQAIKNSDVGTILKDNSASSTAGNVTHDTSTRNVVLNGVPVEQVLAMIQDLFGVKARTKAARKSV